MPASPDGVLRLVIVDDHPAIARGVAAGLADVSARLGDVTAVSSVAAVTDLVVGKGSGSGGSGSGSGTGVDVVILDLQLGDGSDPAANVAQLVAAGLPVLVYTQEGRRSVIGRCFKAGASGIVSKSDDIAVLAEALLLVAQGEPFLSPEWAAALEDAEDWPVPDLAPRESEALSLYATGLPMKSVARRMGVAEDTAKEYLDRARQKYARAGRPAYSKVDLYIRAVEDGYLPNPSP